LSILFRTQGWLTVAQLVRAWAPELTGANTDPRHSEHDLEHCLLEDMINGRLDAAGPEVDGRRLGLRLIIHNSPPGFIDGPQVRELIAGANDPATRAFVLNRLLVLKEAVLDFARRHELPSPSWWTEASGTREPTGDVHHAAAQETNVPSQPGWSLRPDPNAEVLGLRRRRGPKPETYERVKAAMWSDLSQGRYTLAGLQGMREKELEKTYGVSRDTARKARRAVVSEIADKSNGDN
jgi:hypothetical protein